MMAGSVFLLTADIFCFVHSQAVRRKSDTTHQDVAFFRGVSPPLAKKKVKQEPLPYTCQDVTLKKRKAKATAFIQGKIESHLLRKLIVHDYFKNVTYCVYSLLYSTV